MIPYISLFATTSFFSVIALDKRSHLTQMIPVIFLSLVLFVGVRYASVDYFGYAEIYDYVTNFSELSFPNYVPSTGEKPTESLFSLIILIVKLFKGNYEIFIFLVALISIGIKIYAFKKMSNFFFFSLLLYVSMYIGKDMGQIRNGLASGIVLLSIMYTYNKNFLKFHFAAFSAMLVHVSGILAFVLYYIRPFSRTLVMFAVLFISFGVAVYGGVGILLTEILAELFGLGMEFRLIRYVESIYAESYSLFGGTAIIHLFTAVAIIYFKQKLISINKYNLVLIPMYVYGVAAMMIFIDYGVIFARIKDTFCLPSSMIMIPSFLVIFEKHTKIFAYLLFMAYCVVMFYFSIPSEQYATVLYN